jgi:Fe-S-cluster containining protein
MRDGPLRRSVKAVALGVFYAALGLDRLLARSARRDTFLLGGDCRRCAACCEAPAIRVGVLTWHLPLVQALFLWWQEKVNGFVLRERSDDDDRVFVFKCTHFDWEHRRCDSYASRPGMCRDYPRALMYQPHPEMLPGCGYRPIARNAKRLLRVLDAQPMTDEQRARLKKDLFLE